MFNILKIAYRNLLRQKRRTFISSFIIVIGIIAVLVFSGLSKSFQLTIISEITDSLVAHAQIHRKGYLGSIDSIPLDIMLSPKDAELAEKKLKMNLGVLASSRRLKFGALISNQMTTTNIMMIGVNPTDEDIVVPRLRTKILNQEQKLDIKVGEIYIPSSVATTLNLKVGDNAIVIATNKDGSINGKNFKVTAIMESIFGPGGRNAHINIEDAKSILRTEDISEIAIKFKDFDHIDTVTNEIKHVLSRYTSKAGKPIYEIHKWIELTPASNPVRIMDLMDSFLKGILDSLVFFSIYNIMTMSVYERIREIGTMIAIGTLPYKAGLVILCEGLFAGVFSVVLGGVLGVIVLIVLNLHKLKFTISMTQENVKEIILSPPILAKDFIFIALIVLVTSIIASIIPAYKAGKMKPVDALRHN
ncbi:MAG: ABC transporter permease [Spirochaetota bacterium]|nr:ABC transporter permease [Spirochaetota bacterium]